MTARSSAAAPAAAPGSASAAVVRAVRNEVAARRPADANTPHDLGLLLEVADALLHRAALDDEVAARRHRAAAAAGSWTPDDAPGPYCPPGSVTMLPTAVAALVADDPDGEDTRRAVNEARRTELGELPDRDRIELPEPQQSGTVDPAAMERYLRARGDSREVTAVRVLTGGFSKETLLVQLRGADGTSEIVVRKVAAGRAADTLPGEYEVVRFAADGGIPAPRPLWIDPADNPLGGPLFATERLTGKTVGTVTGPTSGATAESARELARLLGHLHSLDVAGLGGTPRPPMASRDDVRAALDQREAIVDGAAEAVPVTPGIVLHRALLTWLRTHIPDLGRPPVLVHGDVGFHNVLVSDGAVTALLDWEMAHRGQPAEDLAYVRPSVRQLLDWPEFLEIYLAAGGRPVDEEELRFFTVWQDFWRATSCLRLRTKFVLDPSRLSDGVSGLLLGTRFLDNALTTAFGER
ncbi:phosphotransferase family protein [Pseudonocardia acidicola]|uniref:Phosphotransferase family protein n=1 Tax=Pseudonocardia acidicola TaxID=2724939 RepID=A0ABX1S9K1_9PSEU|nr:phosphotransferase family protein [Pseudonocardia acidicola]NMH98244.1 phosphotransferase family protein [Pseudonocardia acidicola]